MATIHKYSTFLKTQMNGGSDTTGNGTASTSRVVDFDTDSIKIMLVTNSYSPDADAHAVKGDVTNEVSGTNYTAGGSSLNNASVTLTNGEVFFKADNVIWNEDANGFNDARYGILYKDTGTASTSTLIAYMDFISDKGNDGSDLVIQFNQAGIIKWY